MKTISTEKIISITNRALNICNITDEDLRQDAYLYALQNKEIMYSNKDDTILGRMINFILDKQRVGEQINDIRLKKALETLDDEHSYAIRAAYGVGWPQAMTVDQIAVEYGYEPEKMYIVISEGLNLLKNILA